MEHADAPNFFILGGAKCGTTSLYHLLSQADDVFLTERKEPRFFGNTATYERGVEWYLKEHFRGAGRFKARGEATPNYLHRGRIAAERVRSSLGEDLKFIVLLRDPVRRAWSHYLHMRRLGTETLPFREALEAEARRLEADPESWFGYFSDGLYAAQLREWLAVFPRERFLIQLTARLERDPHGVVQEACRFLGVAPPAALELRIDRNSAALPKNRFIAKLLNRPNVATNFLKRAVPFTLRQDIRDTLNAWNRVSYEDKRPPRLHPRLEETLRRRYAEDIAALEAITAFDLRDWYGREEPQPAAEA